MPGTLGHWQSTSKVCSWCSGSCDAVMLCLDANSMIRALLCVATLSWGVACCIGCVSCTTGVSFVVFVSVVCGLRGLQQGGHGCSCFFRQPTVEAPDRPVGQRCHFTMLSIARMLRTLFVRSMQHVWSQYLSAPTTTILCTGVAVWCGWHYSLVCLAQLVPVAAPCAHCVSCVERCTLCVPDIGSLVWAFVLLVLHLLLLLSVSKCFPEWMCAVRCARVELRPLFRASCVCRTVLGPSQRMFCSSPLS